MGADLKPKVISNWLDMIITGGSKGGARLPPFLFWQKRKKSMKKRRRKKSRQGKQYSQMCISVYILVKIEAKFFFGFTHSKKPGLPLSSRSGSATDNTNSTLQSSNYACAKPNHSDRSSKDKLFRHRLTLSGYHNLNPN